MMKYCILFLTLMSLVGCKISGTVSVDGVPAGGIIVALSGAASKTTTTDSNGEYEFDVENKNASYTITPSSPEVSFTPESRLVNISSRTSQSGVSGVDFTGISYNCTIDSDNDGIVNCNDQCPDDSSKVDLGICGCGIADIDSDFDGTADCNDPCLNDPTKTEPGVCGCGVVDFDYDNDGIYDCQGDTNTVPVAEAGANQYAEIGEVVDFDGTESFDGDDHLLSYQWQLIDAPQDSQAVLIQGETSFPQLDIDVEGIYTLQLIVNDGYENSPADLVRVATPTMLLKEVPDQVEMDIHDVVYLLSSANQQIYRWSLALDFPMTPLSISADANLMTYVPAADHLYVGYKSGDITRIDLFGDFGEYPFTTTPSEPHGLAAAGNYILLADPSGSWNTHYIYDPSGALMASEDWNYRSSEYAWNEVNSRIYFFRDGTSPNDLHYEVIDQQTGEITGKGETPYHGAYPIMPPIRLSKDGTRVLLGSGDIYNADTLELSNSLPITLMDGVWLDSGLVTLRMTADGRTLLEQWNSDYTLYNFQYFAGEPLRILARGDSGTIITTVNGQPTFYTYEPTNDADNDGVLNSQDAFPLDQAASVDSDLDGYPDLWNDGKSMDDSTTGLQLDYFPLDSACQLASHGLINDPNVCDIGAHIPAYTPDKIILGGDNVIYLLSGVNEKVYRWSLDQDKHLNPLYLQGSTDLMAYDAMAHSLYLGYDSGAITRINLNEGIQEFAFATTPGAPHGLAMAGNYVLLADPSGSWNTHYIYGLDGTLVFSADWNRYSKAYAWNGFNSHIYFFRDGTSPNDLHYEVIDQQTGEIVERGETPYHGDYIIAPPLRVSKDGTAVLLGSGDIYDAETLELINSLPNAVEDGLWQDSGLITLRTSSAGQTLLEQWNNDYILYRSQDITGEPLRVLDNGALNVVITLVNGEPVFNSYTP